MSADRTTPSLLRALHALADRWEQEGLIAGTRLDHLSQAVAQRHVREIRALLPANRTSPIRHWRTSQEKPSH